MASISKKNDGKESSGVVKVGQEFELSLEQDMWKDDVSGVFLQAPGINRISRPKGSDYRTQIEWFNANRLKNQKDVIYKEDDVGKTSFKVTENMNTKIIERAVKAGILVPKGTVKRVKLSDNAKKHASIYSTDKTTGREMYTGPHKTHWAFLQKRDTKALVTEIKDITDPALLESLLEIEQKGYNYLSAPRAQIIDILEKQLRENAIGLTQIKETEFKTLKEEIVEDK